MLFEFQYFTEKEKQNILENNAHMYLIKEQNIASGNFLIFSEKPIPEKISYVNIPEGKVESLEQSIAELTMAMTMMMGGI